MKTDEINLFRTLEPPTGGLERFRRRLEQADGEARRLPAPRMVAAGLAAGLLAAVVTALFQASGDGNLEDGAGRRAVNDPGSIELRRNRENDVETPSVTIAAEFRASPAFARLLGQPLETAETRVSVEDQQVAVAEIPSTNSNVRIYEIRDH